LGREHEQEGTEKDHKKKEEMSAKMERRLQERKKENMSKRIEEKMSNRKEEKMSKGRRRR
jgi:hypothetical protein